MPEPSWVWLFAGVAGLLIGSFMNVCIYRWPRDLSVIHPRSKCPACDRQIAWYDNVPVLSYLILRGRCRNCGYRIHWQYPLVELLTAVSFAYAVHRDGLTFEAAKYCVFSAIVLGLVFSDLDTRILPDQLTLGGIVIGLVFSIFVAVPDRTFQAIASLFGWQLGRRFAMLDEAVFGAVAPAFVLWLGGWLFEKLRHKEGLGFGDVKMLAMIGAFLGIGGSLLAIILGSITGSIAGLAYIKATRKEAATYQLPFGTFLGIAALVAAAEGPGLIGWYTQTLK